MSQAEEGKGRKAWVNLLTKPDYVPALLTMWRTLRCVTKYPLVIMATDSLPESSRKIVQREGLEIIDIPFLAPTNHPGFDAKFLRLGDAWTKLRAFCLEGFERVIMIDSDVLLLREMDGLFDLELPADDWIGAAPACICNPFHIHHYPKDWTPENCAISRQTRQTSLTDQPIPPIDGPFSKHQLNSGLVMLKPSPEIMAQLEVFLNTSPIIATSNFADQDVFCNFFMGRWKPLPWYCNALKTERAVHPDVWADDEVRMIHYILDKPWVQRPALVDEYSKAEVAKSTSSSNQNQMPPALAAMVKDSPPQRGAKEYDEVHSWWWLAYEDVLRELKANGEEGQWQEVDKYVTR